MVKLMLRQINHKKRAQSLMLSYVILVSIVIAISIGVFTWLKYAANVEPVVNCNEGTSIRLTDINCSSSGVDLNLKNNGRFSIDGIILTVSNETGLTFPTYLVPKKEYNAGLQAGSYFFDDKLKPDNSLIAEYSLYERRIVGEEGFGDATLVDFDEIKTIQIQPFILSETGIVVCQDAVIKQNVDCSLSEGEI